MTRKFLHIEIVLLLLLLPYSCEKLVLSGEGALITVTEQYDAFTNLEVYDIFDIRLRSDSIFSISLKVHEKYLDRIALEFDSGKVALYDRNPEKWLATYPWPVVEITFPRLEGQLTLHSPAWISTPDTLSIPRLNLLSLGKTGDFNIVMDTDLFQYATGSDNSGFYTFSGRAESAHFWPRGSSQIDASMLITKRCNVYNNSIGNCSVYVEERLEARLNTLGNVIYYGDPAEVVLVEESGEGKLIQGKHQ